jgi:hypothetical protein
MPHSATVLATCWGLILHCDLMSAGCTFWHVALVTGCFIIHSQPIVSGSVALLFPALVNSCLSSQTLTITQDGSCSTLTPYSDFCRELGLGKYPTMFRTENITEVDPSKAFVFISTNRGITGKLFDNPYHSKYLYSIGLRPEIMFGCAMNFLFRPKNEVRPSFHSSGTHPGLHARRLQPNPAYQ